MLEQSLKAAFSDFAADQAKVSESFLERIAEHEKNITDAAARLETYREQLLVELAQHADRQMEEAEGKIYAAVSARVVKDIETANAAFLDNLKKLLMFASAAWGFGILLLVCGLIFK
ncbi:tropomyosin [Neisseria sp. 83E34]|nr:tropomyosin [Neisseria sp. 83E34]